MTNVLGVPKEITSVDYPSPYLQPWPSMDHPVQPGWWQYGLHMLDEETDTGAIALSNLTERFTNPVDEFGNPPTDDEGELIKFDISDLHEALKKAHYSVISNRLIQERANANKLMLSREDMDLYLSLAGRPNKAPEFLRLMARVALPIYEQKVVDDLHKERNKAVLEMPGGSRQVGIWNCTSKMDEFEKNFPDVLADTDPDILVRRISTDSIKFLKYEFWPQLNNGEAYSDEFEHGVVRRRRAIADFSVPVLDPKTGVEKIVRMEWVKQAYALAVMKLVDYADRKKVYEEYGLVDTASPAAKKKLIEAIGQSNNTVACILGNIFRYASEREANHETVTMVPVGTNHYVTVRCEGLRNSMPVDPGLDIIDHGIAPLWLNGYNSKHYR